MRYRLTRHGTVFLVVAVLLYLAALSSQSSMLLWLAGVLLGVLVLNLFWARSGLKGLELLPPCQVVTHEGQSLTQPWRLINHRRAATGLVQVDSPAGTLFRLPALAAQKETAVIPQLASHRRGVYPHSQLRLSSFFPFGLIQVTRQLTLPGETIVGPACYLVPPPRAAGYDLMSGGKLRGKHRSASGLHFAGVRPLQPGDSMKQIHWRSSAKGQGLMVKTFEEELSGRVAVILDCGHTGERDTLDQAVRLAGSLLMAAWEAGQQVEWIDLIRLQPQRIPPFSPRDSWLESLARIELNRDGLTLDRLERAFTLVSRRGAVHLVLTGCPDTVRQAITAPKHRARALHLYLPEHTPPPAWASLPLCYYGARHLTDQR